MTTENTATNVITLSLTEASVTGWEKCFEKTIAGYKVGLCLSLSADGTGNVTFGIKVTLGSHTYNWNKTINGNTSINIAIVGPLSLEIAVSNWKLDSNSISFDLKVALHAIISVTLYSGKITLPIPGSHPLAAFDGAAISSPSDVNHLFQLLAALDNDGGETAEESEDAEVKPGGKCYKDTDCTGAFVGYATSCDSCRRNKGRSLQTANGCQKCG